MQEPQPLGCDLLGEIVDAGGVAPGRARLATKPSLTGSSPTPKTIGTVVVAALAAWAARLPPVAITATRRRTRSFITDGKRSNRPSSQWYSTVTFWPSMKPASLRPLRKASPKPATDDEALTKPTTGNARCWACAASGNAAAPPSAAMKSRRRRRICPSLAREPIGGSIARPKLAGVPDKGAALRNLGPLRRRVYVRDGS